MTPARPSCTESRSGRRTQFNAAPGSHWASALVGRFHRLGRVDGCRPASERVEALGGAGAGLGGIDENGQAGVRGDVKAVEAQAEFADDGVVEVLERAGMEADVVCCPVGAKRFALRGEFADEV